MDQADIVDGGTSPREEETMQHQFGSIVMMADVYRQELLADAERVRPIPTASSSGDSAAKRLTGCRRSVGAALIRAGQRIQGVRPLGQVSPDPVAVEHGTVA